VEQGQPLTRPIWIAAWYTIALMAFMLLYTVGGGLWNRLLGERLGVFVGDETSIEVVVLFTMFFLSALSVLRRWRLGYFGTVVCHLFLIAGSIVQFVAITNTGKWPQFWPMAIWGSLLTLVSLIVLVLMLRPSGRRQFFG
jgi:hypothetical protein